MPQIYYHNNFQVRKGDYVRYKQTEEAWAAKTLISVTLQDFKASGGEFFHSQGSWCEDRDWPTILGAGHYDSEDSWVEGPLGMVVKVKGPYGTGIAGKFMYQLDILCENGLVRDSSANYSLAGRQAYILPDHRHDPRDPYLTDHLS